jgi:hypothetical protein
MKPPTFGLSTQPQKSTRKLEALERQLLDTPSFVPGHLLEDMESGAYDRAEEDRWLKIEIIRDELSGREHKQEQGKLQQWIAASMLRLETRDTTKVDPSLWSEDY